ncbi:MAG: transglycosylase domain-containing protein [Desulfobacteraceae bacterium]|jgi:penicillin-binding protein 1C
MNKKYIIFPVLFLILLGVTVTGIHITAMAQIKNLPDSLTGLLDEVRKPQLKDRDGRPITVTYANRWNSGSYVPLHQMPETIKTLFIFSEDKRFYSHNGVDWVARFNALFQNVFSLETVRGASTITEQVVRMIHPRPRTLWSRYLEGCEAQMLERKHSKDDILEFYLNQVPYASNRRGITQAAEYYFNRSTDTLSLKEMLALVVLVRAPSYYDPYKNAKRIEGPIAILAKSLFGKKIIAKDDLDLVLNNELTLEKPVHDVDAAHFARFVYDSSDDINLHDKRKINTTLDVSVQVKVESLMDKILKTLSDKKVKNGACLVADHETGEILAWVSRAVAEDDRSGKHIDGVTTPRQPGSSLKPFLYALALDNGWTASQEIEDSPLTNPVGRGLHTYHNYSHVHYGWVTVRQALGNSLNIPAVKAIRYVGYGKYLAKLHELGFKSLDKHPDFYGDGLALGCGEVSLFELVQAYCVLANKGVFLPIYVTGKGSVSQRIPMRKRIFSEETASLIGNILADSGARKLEFGSDGLLNFPVETAVKTGTSSDYRDSWAMGYNHRFVVGAWLGNFDSRPMNGVSGSLGPAFLLRSVFAELNRNNDTRPLFLSPKLVKKEICVGSHQKDDSCSKRFEWFAKGREPQKKMTLVKQETIGFFKPVNGLEMAMDPRIPDDSEAFEFELGGVNKKDTVTWILDGKELGTAMGNRYLWFLSKGKHVVEAKVDKGSGRLAYAEKTVFVVK